MEEKELIETLAEFHHDTWVDWSREISREENISSERFGRWTKLWIPYSELTEEEKESDRILARKIILKLKNGGLVF